MRFEVSAMPITKWHLIPPSTGVHSDSQFSILSRRKRRERRKSCIGIFFSRPSEVEKVSRPLPSWSTWSYRLLLLVFYLISLSGLAIYRLWFFLSFFVFLKLWLRVSVNGLVLLLLLLLLFLFFFLFFSAEKLVFECPQAILHLAFTTSEALHDRSEHSDVFEGCLGTRIAKVLNVPLLHSCCCGKIYILCEWMIIDCCICSAHNSRRTRIVNIDIIVTTPTGISVRWLITNHTNFVIVYILITFNFSISFFLESILGHFLFRIQRSYNSYPFFQHFFHWKKFKHL